MSVSQLVALLKRDVEEKHRNVRVIGEVSSFKQWRSGHCYFDIKDKDAMLPAVMFKPHVARLPFAVTDGMEMVFSGRVSIYSANARLQMIVEAMEPLGQGALALAFEQLKERLKLEGLFDAQHKQPIKSFNQCVGLITSSHGAVLRDMVRILKTRMPKVNILFVPVRVQGAGAALEIANAVRFLDGLGECDVIIVGRGGGSLEDLWAFNEEIVARAIFEATTPIISAVGHETDTTISDFVADLRAATPTHAASLVVPALAEMHALLDSMRATLSLRHDANLRRIKLMLAQEKRKLADPRVMLFRHWQIVDELHKRLGIRMTKSLRDKSMCLDELRASLQLQAPMRTLRMKRQLTAVAKDRLFAMNPRKRLEQARALIGDQKHALMRDMTLQLANHRRDYVGLINKLDALSPLRVLRRGYSAVEDGDGRIISTTAHCSPGQALRIRLADGAVRASVVGIEQV